MYGRRLGFALWVVLTATPLWADQCRIGLVFEAQAQEEEPGLKERLVELLAQEEDLEVVEAPPLASPASLEQVAGAGKAVGAEVALAFTAGPASYCLEAKLFDAGNGAVVASPSARGTRAEVFDLVDGLSGQLTQNLPGRAGPPLRVAILDFANLAAADYDPFVRGLPDLLATGLVASRGVDLVARVEAQAAAAHFRMEPGGRVAAQGAVEIGRWLGADLVLVGSFGQLVQARTRLVEVRTGRLLAEQNTEAGQPGWDEALAELGHGAARSLSAFRERQHKVAVLSFENHGPAEYEGFVRGLADMLMTNLGQAEGLVVIERVQIERAMQNFALELSGPIDNEKAVEIGQWLGADEVVLGGFTHFGEVFRIDARVISARTGELVVAQNVRGGKGEMMGLVDQLGKALVLSLAERETQAKGGTGELQVRFMITKAEMGERHVYRQLCKLYVDGKYLGLSPEVEGAERWVTLFGRKLRAGKHEVRIVHGYVKNGEWDGEMPAQPEPFEVAVEPGGSATVQYSFEVGWFNDRYHYQHPWRGLPR